MSIQARVLEALRWTTVTRFGGYLLTGSINLLVIRLLAPEDYGLMALCMAWIGFAEMLSGFGQRTVLIQRPTVDEALVRRIFGALILWNLALFAFVQTTASWLGGFYDNDTLIDILRVLSASILLASIAILPAALRWREIDFRSVSLVALAQAVSASLIILTLALRGFGVWALVWGQVGGTVVHTVGILWVTRFRLRPSFRVGGLGAEARFGAPVTARSLVAFFDRQIDTILIGKLLGSVPLGAYSVAGSVSKQPTRVLLQPIQRVATPTFARIQDDPEQIRSYYLRSVEAVVFVFIPLIWGLGVVADDLVTFVMGDRWLAAIPLLQILCIAIPLQAPMRILSSTLDGLGRPEIALRQALTVAVCMPIGIVVGASYGIAGAAVGWTIARLIAMAINLRRALPIVGVGFGSVARLVAPTLAMGAVMGVAVLAAKAGPFAGLAPWLRLPASIAWGAVVFGAGTAIVNRPLLVRYVALARRSLRGGGDGAASGSDPGGSGPSGSGPSGSGGTPSSSA
ncbi:MAG: lipopolysaccharide biosynthesis protein [Deltaproteobacteria bacterium]|nr:lipopolysaccharide biosynthesis protein [Deltaproteobacteria bacterium]